MSIGKVKTFRGAKVRSIAVAPAGFPLDANHTQVERYSAIGYDLAMANRNKSWAKRWLRTHRPGKFR